MPPRPRRGRQAATRASSRVGASEASTTGRTGRARATRSSQATTNKPSARFETTSSKRSKSAASKPAKPNSTHTVVEKATSIDKSGATESKTRRKAASSPPAKAKSQSQPSSKRTGKRSAPSQEEDSGPPKKQTKVSKTRPLRRFARANYEEVWKEVYLAGTEWDQINDVYKEDWDFDHLDEALTDGDLAEKKIYLFGGTEPQLIKMDEDDKKGEVIPVPVITAIVSDIPPPATVGLKSVQRVKEDIVPMADLRISWQAYAPPNVAFRARFKPNVYVLKCNQRFVSLKPKGEEAVHRYDYVLPYFFHPDKEDDEIEDTVVQVLVDLEGRSAPLMCEFDYELDELEEFVEQTLGDDEELDKEKHTKPLKQAIEAAVDNAKLKHKAAKQERKKRIQAMSKEELEGIRNMQLIKFYPQNDWPDVSEVKSRLVNRYYGHAHEVR